MDSQKPQAAAGQPPAESPDITEELMENLVNAALEMHAEYHAEYAVVVDMFKPIENTGSIDDMEVFIEKALTRKELTWAFLYSLFLPIQSHGEQRLIEILAKLKGISRETLEAFTRCVETLRVHKSLFRLFLPLMEAWPMVGSWMKLALGAEGQVDARKIDDLIRYVRAAAGEGLEGKVWGKFEGLLREACGDEHVLAFLREIKDLSVGKGDEKSE